MANGKGRLIYSNGDVYVGEWKDNKTEGYGMQQNFKGSKYEGHWSND